MISNGTSHLKSLHNSSNTLVDIILNLITIEVKHVNTVYRNIDILYKLIPHLAAVVSVFLFCF